MSAPPESWDEDLAQHTEKKLSVQPIATTSTSSFKFNMRAAEFVPSWLPQDPVPAPTQTYSASAPVVAPAPSPAAASPPRPVVKSDPPPPAASAPAAPAPAAKTSAAAGAVAKKATVAAAKDPDFSDIKDDGRETLNIIFIGHVDAGKSTMSGHIMYLTGMVDKRTMEKYQNEAREEGKESWYLSWVMDLNDEERSKGKTVEYGRGYFETEKRRFTVLDAPGHKLYVPSMLGGAAQADVGVLVLSARRGEFETGFERGGQTREHAMLARTAGVKHLICVVNKMDEPTVMWSKERYDEIVAKINPFLKNVGFKEKKDLDYLPVSGFSGANLKERLTKDVCPWYDGPSLLELLDNIDLSGRKVEGPLMMPISDKFKDMGTVVTGKIESGRVKKGQQVLIMPNRKQVEVLAIYIEDQEIPHAKSGDNVRIRLKNVEEEDVMPGFVLCGLSNPVHTVTSFDAEIVIVEHKSIICAGWNCVLHAHTLAEEVSIGSLLHMVDKKTNKRSRHPPKFLKQGDKAVVQLDTSQAVCLEPFKEFEQLGRFTLRDEGKTVAIGKVLKLKETATQ